LAFADNQKVLVENMYNFYKDSEIADNIPMINTLSLIDFESSEEAI